MAIYGAVHNTTSAVTSMASEREWTLGTNGRSFTELLFTANYVETITCATYRNFWNVIFNVWKRLSRVQQIFVGDCLPWIGKCYESDLIILKLKICIFTSY